MAVADAAQDDKAKPPPEVAMAGRIKQWGDPWGGGWMNWPAGLVTRLAVAENVTNALRSVSNVNPGAWAEWEANHPQEAKTHDDIFELRMWKEAHPDEWLKYDSYTVLKARMERDKEAAKDGN